MSWGWIYSLSWERSSREERRHWRERRKQEGRLAGVHSAMSLGFAQKGDEGRMAELQESLRSLRGGEHARRRLDAKKRIMEKGGACYAGRE